MADKNCKLCFHYDVCYAARRIPERAEGCSKYAAGVQEVRHGEWMPVTYTYFGLKRYECSECRDDEFWQKRYLEHKEKFCPNCGADMRGDKRDGK